MITYLLGIPGSGKSYYAVHSIYYNFSKDLKNTKNVFKKDYKTCYTNVNGINYKKLNNVYNLNWDILEQQILELHGLYKKRDKLLADSDYDTIDDILIEKASEYNIYKTLFVIDECHNYFDVQKPHLVWWLTYHRHLHHDLFLITQNLALINSKYKTLAERFYKAKPASLSLISKYFYYNYFTDSRMSQASKVEVIKVLKNKDVFELYQSGDSVKTKNVLFRFLIISAMLVVLLLIVGYYFYYSKFKKEEVAPAPVKFEKNSDFEKKERGKNEEMVLPGEKKSLDDMTDPRIFSFTCSNDYGCSSKFLTYDMTKKFLFSILDYYPYKILSMEKVYDGFYRYMIVMDSKAFDLLAAYNDNDDEENSNKYSGSTSSSNTDLFASFGN